MAASHRRRTEGNVTATPFAAPALVAPSFPLPALCAREHRPVPDPADGRQYCAACGLVVEEPPAIAAYAPGEPANEVLGSRSVASSPAGASASSERRHSTHLAVVDAIERQRALPEDPRTTRRILGATERLGLPAAIGAEVARTVALARRERLMVGYDVPTQAVAAAWVVTLAHHKGGEAWATRRIQTLAVGVRVRARDGKVSTALRSVTAIDRLSTRMGVDRRVATHVAYALMRAGIAERAIAGGNGGGP